ncbi:MAG: hypothetical protein JO097_15530 [Acidobacteriaceae bacterium]|nr:hypothetical protein [Acidobacteriaceae bacterium]MBV9295610.1 hypothetical protein [Acidobacteriaceae bacterium]MBV9764721.1 hypothetical protein [Acidobacteriaceae bacterium]
MPLTHDTWQGELLGFVLSLAGAIIAYFFGKRAQPSCKERLAAIFPGRSDIFYTRIEALLIILLGAIFAHYSFVHRGPLDCLTSGISFSATIKAPLKASLR